MLVDLAWASGLLDLATVHHSDPVGHRKRFFLIMRDVDECRAELVLDALQLVLHLPPQLDVERPERLVEQQGRRAIDERPRKRDPLLLPPGKLPRPPALKSFERDDPHQLSDPRSLVGTRHTLYLEPERDVVVDRHMRKERVLLEDHVHRALVRRDSRNVVAL